MTPIKKALLVLLVSVSALLAPVRSQAQAFMHQDGPTNPPDGLVDALTQAVPTHPYGVTFFTAIPQTNGTVVCAFIVQGVGRWTFYEVCPNATTKVIATGMDSPTGNEVNFIILPADGQYVSCFISACNLHAWPDPTL